MLKIFTRGCDDVLCNEMPVSFILARHEMHFRPRIRCLSAAITERLTEVDGPHLKRTISEAEHGVDGWCQDQENWLKNATRLTEDNAT
jgi:hypothetical protein